MTETSSSVTWQWKERLQRGFRRFGGLLAIVTLLIKAMISQVDVHVKTYSVKHFKYVHFIVCQLYLYIVVQLLSCVGLFMTPWTAARQASLSFTVSQSLLKLRSIESMMPSQLSHPLSSPSPPAFSLSLHQGFFSSLHQVDKILELQLQHQSFQ